MYTYSFGCSLIHDAHSHSSLSTLCLQHLTTFIFISELTVHPIPRDDEKIYGVANQGGGDGGADGDAGGYGNQTGGGGSSTDRGEAPVIVRKAHGDREYTNR